MKSSETVSMPRDPWRPVASRRPASLTANRADGPRISTAATLKVGPLTGLAITMERAAEDEEGGRGAA